MVACAKRSRRRQPKWQALFLAMLPTIRRHAIVAFRDLSAEAWEEAVQEVVANACVAFARLVEQGRSERAFPSALARFAVAQVRDGRKVGTSQNVRDVLSPCAKKKSRGAVERLDRLAKHEGEWVEAVLEDTRTPVPDQVWFRIDFPRWLATLSPPQSTSRPIVGSWQHYNGRCPAIWAVAGARFPVAARALRVLATIPRRKPDTRLTCPANRRQSDVPIRRHSSNGTSSIDRCVANEPQASNESPGFIRSLGISHRLSHRAAIHKVPFSNRLGFRVR